MNSIETINLTHSFSSREQVLNDINLQVGTGSIFGFLGPNGAGKTTTLKLIVGLLKRQQGEILIFGKPFDRHRTEILRNIGSLIETPSLYGHLTATENLRVYQRVYQCPQKRINEVLELVGLATTGSKKASQFSLGMKQRLSIAMALLHQPSLLILDEPTNGLDPNGILEIRELLKTLASFDGITILISSHLLSEIEKLVTHVGIINKGNLLFQGTLADLHNKQEKSARIVIATSDNHRAAQILKDKGIESVTDDNRIAISMIANERIARLNEQFVQNRIDVYQIGHETNDLEKIFFDVINR